MSDKRCPACMRDPDPRGWSACFDCRELNADRVLPPRFPQHVAGLARAVDDYVAAFRAMARFPNDPDICGNVTLCELALDGAVAIYREAQYAREGVS